MQVPGVRVRGFSVLPCTYPLPWRKEILMVYRDVRGVDGKAKLPVENKDQTVS
jgi:hypothetical protein